MRLISRSWLEEILLNTTKNIPQRLDSIIHWINHYYPMKNSRGKNLNVRVKNYGVPYLGRNVVMTLNYRFGCCSLERKSKLICHCLYQAFCMWHNAGLHQPYFCYLRTVEGSQICKRATVAHSCLLRMQGRRYYYAL